MSPTRRVEGNPKPLSTPFPSPKETAIENMPTEFVKGDEVRVHATKFDGEGEKDELGMIWSQMGS